MEHPKIERLLQLIMLMASKTDYTIEDLACKLRTTSRSVYRYICTLRNAGFVIEKRKTNIYKLIHIPNSSVNLNTLVYFSQEEATLLISLIHKLEGTNTLKTGLQKKLSAVYNTTNLADFIVDKNTAQHIETLGNAIRTKQRTILHNYQSANSHTVSNRHVEPFAFSTNFIDIWAYDIEKQENRMFKISRIGAVELLKSPWKYEATHKQLITDCFRMNGEQSYNIKLKLSIRAKNLLIEEFPLAEKDLTEINGNWTLDTTVYNLAGVGRFVIGLAEEVSIIDSPDLEAYVKAYAEKHILSYIRKDETNSPALNVFTTE